MLNVSAHTADTHEGHNMGILADVIMDGVAQLLNTKWYFRALGVGLFAVPALGVVHRMHGEVHMASYYVGGIIAILLTSAIFFNEIMLGLQAKREGVKPWWVK